MRLLPRLAMTFTFGLLASSAALAAANAPAPGADAKARDQAQLAFQRDLVSVLAPQAEAMPLLAASLLAQPLRNQPSVNSFHKLIGRAAMADGADAAVNWVRLADCDTKADTCPNSGALQSLLEQAPDNAAVWLLKLGTDARAMRQDDARADLAKAAAARHYEDYTGTSLQALARSVGVLPPPPAALGPGGAAGLQAVMVFGLGASQPQPSLPLTAKLCENGSSDPAIKADCLKLGKLLEWGSSPLARSLGLHLRQTLDDDPASQADAKQASLNLLWQVQNFNQLLAKAGDDPDLAGKLLALARNGGTQMSLILAALRDNGIEVFPPAGWQPRSAEQ